MSIPVQVAAASGWLQCAIADCGPFRLGVIVNYIFFVLGIVVLMICSLAWTPREDVRDKLAQEIGQQARSFGYASFLIAGCAFFGAVTLTYQNMSNHWLFLMLWIIFFFIILLLEVVNGKMAKAPSTKLRPVQCFAFVTSLIANYWIWTGGANSLTGGP